MFLVVTLSLVSRLAPLGDSLDGCRIDIVLSNASNVQIMNPQPDFTLIVVLTAVYTIGMFLVTFFSYRTLARLLGGRFERKGA